ncbi:MAG: putative DNA binding domain-containing protein [Bacteroidales bacterium]|nr:putative DNA binding domain-containing protein [Bacteroidales bacterium]
MSESQLVEYKESWREEYLKWICGFANAQGGTLFIGIDDKGEVCGVANSKKLLEDIPNKVRDQLGLIVDVDLETRDGKDVIKITVPENPYPVNYKGEYHYRTGSTKQLLHGSMLTHFLIKKTGKKWDSVPLENVGIDDLDKESFDIFYRESVRSGRMSADDLKLSRHDLLDKLNLLDGSYLKRAAVLLFHRNPEKWITGSFVKIGFFETDADLRYQDEIHGSLMIQADRVIDLIYTKYLIAEISYDNITRIEHYPFPKDAVREAVFNALIHQDFSAGIPVQISVYRDRLYISNDCIFPDDWTAETLMQKHRSLPLNPDIANTFYRAGFIESWGRGIEKICTLCKNHNIPNPEYTVHGADIMMMFKVAESGLKSSEKNENVLNNVLNQDQNVLNTTVEIPDTTVENGKSGLKSTEKSGLKSSLKNESSEECGLKSSLKNEVTIISAIEKNSCITIPDLQNLTGMSRNGVKKVLNRLRSKGIIRREGPDKGGKWIVLKSGD